MKKTPIIKPNMIAPCGMNCTVCYAHFREKDQCGGCNTDDKFIPNSCNKCKIKHCEIRKNNNYKFCYQCDTYPCKRLKQLDKRYRTKYGMSMLENLSSIKEHGIREFVKKEKERWKCNSCGELLCVHKEECPSCASKERTLK